MLSKVIIVACLVCAVASLELFNVGDNQFKKDDKNLIFFAGSQCMYSEKQEPEVEKAELESGNGWTFWRINCNKNGNNELCHKWGVHSFPQIGAYVFGRIVPVMSHKRGGWRLITKYIEELNAKYP